VFQRVFTGKLPRRRPLSVSAVDQFLGKSFEGMRKASGNAQELRWYPLSDPNRIGETRELSNKILCLPRQLVLFIPTTIKLNFEAGVVQKMGPYELKQPIR
jgi:hypothetical protein